MFLKFDSMVSKQFYPRQKSVEKGDERNEKNGKVHLDGPPSIYPS